VDVGFWAGCASGGEGSLLGNAAVVGVVFAVELGCGVLLGVALPLCTMTRGEGGLGRHLPPSCALNYKV